MAGILSRLKALKLRLESETDGASGGDYVAITPITGVGTSATDTVQEALEAIAVALQAQDDRERLQAATSGDITASVTATYLGMALQAGTIPTAALYVANTGQDSSNALTLELDVLINGTSIWTTKPKISKTAADGARTNVAGTGVTVGVVDATKNILAVGDIITYSLTLVRTASPTDEMDGAKVEVQIANALLA